MDIRKITPDYAVGPQIEPEDLATLAADGFVAVINNRPDDEVMADLAGAEMQKAAEAAGLRYIPNPVVNGAMTMANVETQKTVLDSAEGPVFAWCRSGTRSSIMWALSQAGQRPTEEILNDLRTAGYDLPQLAPQIDALAQG